MTDHAPIIIATFGAAEALGWSTLFELDTVLADRWFLIGGELIRLHAAEAGVTPPRPTVDVDIVVNLQTRPDGLRVLADWLIGRGFTHADPTPGGLGGRYVAATTDGSAVFDVLATDHAGTRADLTTTPPARTVEVPGSRSVAGQIEAVHVRAATASGVAWRPHLAATLVLKARASNLPARGGRDVSDAAFVASLIADPIAARHSLSDRQRSHLRRLDMLLDADHPAWVALDDAAATRGHAALTLMLA